MPARVDPPEPRSGSAFSGHLAGIDADGRLQFRRDGLPDGSADALVPVSIGVALTDNDLVEAARRRARAIVLRTDDPEPVWVLLALPRERVSESARPPAAGELDVVVDGRTLCLSASREILLRCGEASLLLRSDGRVVLSGIHVISRSKGAIKIKGASVEIN